MTARSACRREVPALLKITIELQPAIAMIVIAFILGWLA